MKPKYIQYYVVKINKESGDAKMFYDEKVKVYQCGAVVLMSGHFPRWEQDMEAIQDRTNK